MKYFGERRQQQAKKIQKKTRKINELQSVKIYEKSLKCLCMKKEENSRKTEKERKSEWVREKFEREKIPMN